MSRKHNHLRTQILEHVARYRLTTLPALCQLPAFRQRPESSVKRLLRSLVRDGQLQRAALFHNRNYYCSRQVSRSPSGVLSESEKLRAYAMLLYCCLGTAQRERLTRSELHTHFPVLSEPGLPLNYYVDSSGDTTRLGVLRVDLGGRGRWDRILGKARDDVLKHQGRTGIRDLIRQGQFEVTIMTALPQKAARICDTMTSESHPLDACIRVSSASELLYLIAPPHD
ncbi:MAG: hypothetical protein ACYTGL_28390 [Planctomycetota bacterium]|jgi:hypothetical protein